MKDHEHPFFRPLWRRVAVVAVCAAWSIFEFATGASMWGTIALAFTAYAVWQFFFLYKEPEPAGSADDQSGQSGAKE
ncbi:DUF3329 domain-containing protein [Mesorhizobium sp. ZMM04-5]|uniref:DUF3329 domain-containing protein n=1 Tax=Mesorhizobium marinum TaxID=3228790 RepID=A0ABV3R028_9HYPH